MNRPESYNSTVATPLLTNLYGAPTTATTVTDTNGSTNNRFANSSPRSNNSTNSTPKQVSPVDKIAIHNKEYVGPCFIDGEDHRKWIVAVSVNGQPEQTIDLVDPFTEKEYHKNNDNRLQRGNLELNQDRTEKYFNRLFDQLGLSDCRKKDCRISVHEDVTQVSETSDFASIHSLLWEVLEHPEFWPHTEPSETPTKRVRLSRTLNVLSKELTTATIDRQASCLVTTQAEYRVLLVIARSFKKNIDQRYVDYPASLIQGPLLNIARRTRERGITPKLNIDVVRPGTVEELDEYLKPGCGKPYDIVHFDLHGKIGPVKPPVKSWTGGRPKPPVSDENTPLEVQSYLRFARPYDPELASFGRRDDAIKMLLHDDASLHDVPVKEIARKLQRCNISKVTLNACLSSYAQSRIFLNMCHTFISYGIAHVSAMSFQILESTAEVYYTAFYEALILKGEEFHVAAASGRRALRANNNPYGHAVLPTNYHRYPRSFSNEWWRRPHEKKPGRLPPLASHFARYGVIVILFALYLTYLWHHPPFLSMLLPIASIFAMIVWVLTRRWLMRFAPTIEPTYERYNGKLTRKSRFEIDIEHLVIEDRLKSEANQGALYVWSSQYSKELSDSVHDLAQTWVLTGFVDKADIISASVFSWAITSMFPCRWLRTRRYRSNRVGTVGRRQLLIIKDFDHFYPKHAKDEELEDLRVALHRMVSFIEGYDREDTYLLITGSYDEEWWIDGNRYNDERIVDTIVRAVPHNHNTTPSPPPQPKKEIPRWSLEVMRKRWLKFWNEIV